jgi:chromate transporter
MSPVVLYLLLLKATITSFAGLASLPVIRHDLVEERRVLTPEALDTAVIVSRTTPGPVGVYIVSVGYLVGGAPGAVAGWLAMCTPALVVIAFVRSAGRYVHNRRIQCVTRGIVVASAGLLLSAGLPLAEGSLIGAMPIAIAVACLAALLLTKIDPLWVVVAASLAGLVQIFF